MLGSQDDLGEEEIAETAGCNIDGYIINPLNYKSLEGKVKEALKNLFESMESSVCLARAVAFVDIGAKEEAASELVSAQEAQPKSSRIWVETGYLFEEIGDNEQAKKSYVQATEVDEECARAYDGMASIMNKEGKPDEASNCSKRL